MALSRPTSLSGSTPASQSLPSASPVESSLASLARPHERISSTRIHLTQPIPITSIFSTAEMASSHTITGLRQEAHDPNETAIMDSDVLSTAELPSRDLQPFFTLIEDSTTGMHHHPEIHYVFSDDDCEALVQAAQDVEIIRQTDSKQGQPRERVVVVDLDPDGTTVLAARSLSNDWQVIDASVATAPMLNAPAMSEQGRDGDERKLMLRIEGVGRIDASRNSNEFGKDGAQEGSIEEEVKAFMGRMTDLGKIVQRAERDVDKLQLDGRREIESEA